MSANGKLNNGDVFLDKDGDIRVYAKNTWDAWYPITITKEYMFIQEARVMNEVPHEFKFLVNLRELLLTIKKEVQDEPSN
jgi:hypothetical protein